MLKKKVLAYVKRAYLKTCMSNNIKQREFLWLKEKSFKEIKIYVKCRESASKRQEQIENLWYVTIVNGIWEISHINADHNLELANTK